MQSEAVNIFGITYFLKDKHFKTLPFTKTNRFLAQLVEQLQPAHELHRSNQSNANH